MALNSKYGRRLLHRLAAGQDGRCCYCKRPFTKDGETRPTLEHTKARMDGGADRVSNLAAACHHCNQHRGQQMNHARQMAGRRKPPNG
ncbi:HNH endonuclease [Mesorhizobium sp. Cs1299R1N3]|uniref:HNH endonuclease n=1 Tax=Mesorhizobium sp. Cs1299R1N3 TaxID=3015173 RepID=UPI003FA5336F